jgi:hypothetical protein
MEPIDNPARIFTPGETKALGTGHYLWKGRRVKIRGDMYK